MIDCYLIGVINIDMMDSIEIGIEIGFHLKNVLTFPEKQVAIFRTQNRMTLNFIKIVIINIKLLLCTTRRFACAKRRIRECILKKRGQFL